MVVLSSPRGKLGSRCNADADCANIDACLVLSCQAERCVSLGPVDCDDSDECTKDTCDRLGCVHEPRTPDLDGDGHRAPLPGIGLGQAGACGDDCDDSRAEALPGGREICDGADNDCNGIIDDDAEYQVSDTPALQLTQGNKSGLGGLTHTGKDFVLSISYNDEHDQNGLVALSPDGNVSYREALALVNNDTFAGPLSWNGAALATAWEDRRDDDYEIYFNRLDADGHKLDPDLRVSNAPDFSLNPSLIYTGNEYVVLWNDRREGHETNHIFGQRIGRDGSLLSTDNVDLTPDRSYAEAPSLALGSSSLGFTYNYQDTSDQGLGRWVAFRTLSLDLASTGPEQVISEKDGTGSAITRNGSNFVITWEVYGSAPGDAIWGTVLDEQGNTLIEPRRITEPVAFARTHDVIPLGDRLLLFWAQLTSDRYQIAFRTLDSNLQPLDDAQILTDGSEDALAPIAAFGTGGSLGFGYIQYVEGTPQVFFDTLSCAP